LSILPTSVIAQEIILPCFIFKVMFPCFSLCKNPLMASYRAGGISTMGWLSTFSILYLKNIVGGAKLAVPWIPCLWPMGRFRKALGKS